MKFDFFGVVVELEAAPKDLDDASFLYSHNRTTDTATADLRVSLRCVDWERRGFFASLLAKDRLRKRVTAEQRNGDRWEPVLDEQFTGWSGVPSVLPPFRHSALWRRVGTRPGNALITPGGRGVMLCGANYVGKTAVAIALCRRGWRLVSDATVILNRENGRMLPYNSPLGFRRKGLLSHLDLLESVETRETVNPDTGLVVLARPQDVLGSENRESALIDVIVRLDRADVEAESRWVPTGPVSWYAAAGHEAFVEFLPSRRLDVTIPPSTPPDQIAASIDEELHA